MYTSDAFALGREGSRSSGVYTKEQMQKAFDAGYANADDSYPGPGFEEFLTTLTPGPSADVVERVAKAVNDFRDDPTMFTGTEYRWVFLVKALAPIIEAEVERRVSGYREALEMCLSSFKAYGHIEAVKQIQVVLGRRKP